MAITKRNNYMIFVLLTYVLFFICRIPLYHMIGADGMAYFGIANELLIVAGGTIFYSMQEATASLIKYRIRREQYTSAGKVFRGAVLWGVVFGVILAVVFGIAGGAIASAVFHVPLAGLAIRVVSAAIPFAILTGVFRGFFLGNNMRAPLLHSNVVFVVIYGISSMVCAIQFLHYGKNVSALLRSEEFQYGYGAMGAAVGLVLASIISFLYLLILYLMLRTSLKQGTGREYQKTQDTKLHIFHMLMGTGVFYVCTYLVFYAARLLEQLLLFSRTKGSMESISGYGNYYAKCDTVMMIVVLGVICICYPEIRKVLYYMDREEYRGAREKLGMLIHKSISVVFFATILFAVLAENVLDLFFAGNHSKMTGWLQVSFCAGAFLILSFLLLSVLIRMKKGRMVLLIGAVALLIRMITLWMFLAFTGLGVMAIPVSRLIADVGIAGCSFVIISRNIQYHQEWIRSVAIPVGASAGAGLIAMLFNKLLSPAVGNVLSMVICFVIALLCYLAILLVTRNFREEELNGSLFGRFMIKIGKMMNLF